MGQLSGDCDFQAGDLRQLLEIDDAVRQFAAVQPHGLDRPLTLTGGKFGMANRPPDRNEIARPFSPKKPSP